jgi:hypothetical protein
MRRTLPPELSASATALSTAGLDVSTSSTSTGTKIVLNTAPLLSAKLGPDLAQSMVEINTVLHSGFLLLVDEERGGARPDFE